MSAVRVGVRLTWSKDIWIGIDCRSGVCYMSLNIEGMQNKLKLMRSTGKL